jgi:hypothetical protein
MDPTTGAVVTVIDCTLLSTGVHPSALTTAFTYTVSWISTGKKNASGVVYSDNANVTLSADVYQLIFPT